MMFLFSDTMLIAFMFFQSALFQEQTSTNTKDSLEEMEMLYLQCSFNTLPPDVQGTDQNLKGASADGQFAAIPSLRNKLEQFLLCVADNLLNCVRLVSTVNTCVLVCVKP